MIAICARFREAVISSVKAMDTIVDIGGCMRMYQVNDNTQSQLMRFIHEILEVVWGS